MVDIRGFLLFSNCLDELNSVSVVFVFFNKSCLVSLFSPNFLCRRPNKYERITITTISINLLTSSS